MGQYFGIKPDEEKYIWEVAEMGLCAPLPPGWQEHVAEVAGQPPSIAFRWAWDACPSSWLAPGHACCQENHPAAHAARVHADANGWFYCASCCSCSFPMATTCVS
jgi:hypothetical protein